MTEKRMVFWHTSRLARQFNMPRHVVGVLLKSIGAKQWSKGGCCTGTTWYWEE